MTTTERYEAYQTQNPELCLESPIEWEVYRVFKTVGIVPTLQYPVEPYWIDFAFPDQKIAIEYDGEIHLENEAHDKKRDKYLNSLGWEVIRLDKEFLYRRHRSKNEDGEMEIKNGLEVFAEEMRPILKAKRLCN